MKNKNHTKQAAELSCQLNAESDIVEMKVIEIQDGDIWADVEEAILKSSLPFNKDLYMILLWSVLSEESCSLQEPLCLPITEIR